MSVSSISQSISGSGASSGATSQLASDYQTFLKLLVAQVQNQDPMAPMESTEFVSQLAQLTQVEQSVQVNSQMESLRQQLALNGALSETALIGREVTMASDSLSLGDEGSNFSYKLEQPAYAVQAQIRDASGTIIRVFDALPQEEGKMHEVLWDGMTDSGTRAPNGKYQFSIAATGADGSQGSYNSYSSGEVAAIEYADGAAWLQLADGRRVQSADIIRAR